MLFRPVTGGQKLLVRKQKYGIIECLNDHEILTCTFSGISLKICILAKSNTVFPFLEFIKPKLQGHQV